MLYIDHMIKYTSLKLKLSIPIIAIILFVFILSSIVIIQRETQVAKDTIIISAQSFSKISVAEIISNYELYYESGFFKFTELTSNLMQVNEDIKKIQIYNVNGVLLFDSDEIDQGKYDDTIHGVRKSTDDELIDMIEKIDSTFIESPDKKNFEIIQPYIDEWGPHEYSIKYIYSFTRLITLQQEMVLIVTFNSAVFFIISFISIFILLSQYVTKPIQVLIQGVRKIQKGKLGQKIQITSRDELGELATSYNNMTIDLKESHEQLEEYSKSLELLVEQKNQLIIQLSHDLKNPLGPITNLVTLLKKIEKDDAKKEMLEVLQRNAEYMKNLVIKTIEYARVNSSELPMNYKHMSLLGMVKKIIAAKKTLIQTKKLTIYIDVDEQLMIWVDTLYFEELLTNIVDNAILFNNQHGTITIQATSKKDSIEISISDTGIGIEKEKQPLIFDEFYKVDESRHDFESSGLGLTIAKKIVELHGGTIWITSKGKDKGTTVSFTIPNKGK